MDWVSAAFPLGYTFGRLGNFFNAELYGRPVEGGMLFPNAQSYPLSNPEVLAFAKEIGAPLKDNRAYINLPRHPSQLYEALGEGLKAVKSQNNKILIVDENLQRAKEFASRLEALNYSLLSLCSNLEMVKQTIAMRGRPTLALVKVDLAKKWEGLSIVNWLWDTHAVSSLLVLQDLSVQTIEELKKVKHLGLILLPYRCLEEEKVFASSIKDLIVLRSYEGNLIYCDETLFDFFNQKQLTLQEVYLLSSQLEEIAPVEISFLDVNSKPVKLIISIKDLRQIRVLEKKLTYYKRHDTLTGLLKRQIFFQEIENLYARSRISNESHILLYLDIDRFQSLNENLGEENSNRILKEISTILQESVNFSKENLVSRIGSDDFAILLKGTNTYKALELAWFIKRNIANIDLSRYESVIKQLPVSIGLARFNAGFKNASAVLSAAQNTCKVAKESGGNQIRIFEAEEEIFKNQRSKLLWISSLTKALDNNLFQLFYQHIVPLKEGLLPKIEVLLRFYNEEGERVSPQEFILVAESNGLMPEIDKWVIRNALACFHEFNRLQKEDYLFSINISAETIKRTDITDFILQEIETNKIPHHMIYFEITETALIENINVVKEFVIKLKESDIACSLDDFGNGYTSFSSLKELPVEVLKVDGLFIRNITTNQVSQAVVHALRQLTEAMNILMVAEFIENEEILEVVKRLGSDYGQGHLWGVPKPLLSKSEL
ncbi:UNVERIFIED_CONTAM: hypothetical protein PYX00_011903 [Menopon gallinae]|uniref:Diguanylate cyclase/phosphodiesterase n=1 Tax=Menopon gallinae TaxID=328185 RepID=A0AAW2H905_9NEOP